MGKKALLVVLVLVSCSLLWAEGDVSIGTGASIAWQPTSSLKELSSYSFSSTNRAKVLWTSFTLDLGYRAVQGMHDLSWLLSGGFCLELWQRVRISLEMGPRFHGIVDGKGKWHYYDEDGILTDSTKTLDLFANSPVNYRLSLDVLVARMSVGLFWEIETKYRFVSWQNVKNLFAWVPGNSLLGVTAMYEW